MDEQELEDAEICVPEPVVWEWAEHTYKKMQSIEVIAEQLGKTGLSRLRALKGIADGSIGDVVQSIEDELKQIDRLRILRLADEPGAAIDGLRDQVLQTRAGKLKGAEGTKTGAADSASFRLIEIAGGDGLEDSVALVSGDKDVRRHFCSGVGPILVSDWNLLQLSLLAMVPTEEEARTAAAGAIRSHLRKFVADIGDYLQYDSLEGDVDRAQSQYAHYEPRREVGISHLDRIGPAEILSVSRRAGYASAQVDVTLTLFSQSAWYDVMNESVEQDEEVFPDVPAVVSIWADNEDGDWDIAIQTVFVPEEGSDEALRILAAVDTDEPSA